LLNKDNENIAVLFTEEGTLEITMCADFLMEKLGATYFEVAELLTSLLAKQMVNCIDCEIGWSNMILLGKNLVFPDKYLNVIKIIIESSSPEPLSEQDADCVKEALVEVIQTVSV